MLIGQNKSDAMQLQNIWELMPLTMRNNNCKNSGEKIMDHINIYNICVFESHSELMMIYMSV